MFVDQLIVFSSANHILRLYYKQQISKEPESDDQVVPVIMVDKFDRTIDYIDNVFKAGAPAKPERVIQTRKIIMTILVKKKRMHMLNMIDTCFTWKVID